MKRIYQQWITSIIGAIIMFLGVWLISVEVARYTTDVAYNISINWALIVGLFGLGFVLLRAKDDWIMQKLGIKKSTTEG